MALSLLLILCAACGQEAVVTLFQDAPFTVYVGEYGLSASGLEFTPANAQ